MVIALGITMTGEKRFLGFVETDTENAQVLTPFLRSLLERGLDISQGVLVILDGGKGLRAAVRKAFRRRAVVPTVSVAQAGERGQLSGQDRATAVAAAPPAGVPPAGIRRGRGCAQAAAWRVGGSESIGGPQSD